MSFTINRRSLLPLFAGALLAGVAASAANAQVVIIERPMPATLVEVMGVAPHPGWHWVRGHWGWAPGGWRWRRGQWVSSAVPEMPVALIETPSPMPHPNWFWIKGHYVWEGNHWDWRRGHWDHA